MEIHKWIQVGRVVASQGNKGEIRVLPTTDFPERFASMDQVLLFGPTGQTPAKCLAIEGMRFHKEMIILKLVGVDTIDAAQELANMDIKVDQSQVMPLPDGLHYIFQIVGLKTITTAGLELGIIADVLKTAAHDVYVVKPHPGITQLREILIPVTKSVVLDIDLEKQTVVVDLPEGLLS